jgi:hypothetical protein
MMAGGQPTKYRPEFADQVERLCLLGLTNEELASFFEVHIDTLYEWAKVHPEFSEARARGREIADSKVAEKLYRRALGYSHEAVKIVADAKTGAEHIVPYTEHYPPDTQAATWWLKNRRPDKWGDKQEVKHSGSLTLEGLVTQSMAKEDGK